jgi:drug/metabolite transporter (DMT)-like permease
MSRVSVARLAGLSLIWGSSFLFIKVAVEGLSPAQLALARLTEGALVLLAVVAAGRLRLPRRPVTWLHLTVAATVANVVPFFLFGWGEQRVASSLAGILNATTPLFAMVIAAAIGSVERISPLRAAGLLLGFAGVLVVAAPWRQASLHGSLTGAAACLAAAACYGVGFIYMRRFLTGRGTPPIVLAACQLSAGALLLWLAAPLYAAQAVTLSPRVVASTAALGILGTGIAYILNYRLIADEGATTASTVGYFLPIVAVFLGVIVLGEPLAWNLFAGTAVVLLGVALSEGRLRSADLATRDDPRQPSRHPQVDDQQARQPRQTR